MSIRANSHTIDPFSFDKSVENRRREVFVKVPLKALSCHVADSSDAKDLKSTSESKGIPQPHFARSHSERSLSR